MMYKRVFVLEERPLDKVKITTGSDNFAQQLYKKALGAQPDAVLHDYYDGDELVMFARRPHLEKIIAI